MSEFIIFAKDDSGWVRKDIANDVNELESFARNFRKTEKTLNFSPKRWVSERFFDEYKNKMESLRAIDSQIKSWSADLDDCLDRAKSSNKAARPLDAIFWLSQINTRLKLVANKKPEILDLTNDEFNKFYGDAKHQVEENYFDHSTERLVQAGLVDSFWKSEPVTNLGRKYTDWKMQLVYRKKLELQRKAITSLLELAEKTLSAVFATLVKMDEAKTDGNIEEYLKYLREISSEQSKFEITFRKNYELHFAAMAEQTRKRQQDIIAKQKEEEARTGVADHVEIITPVNEQAPATQPAAYEPPAAPPLTEDEPNVEKANVPAAPELDLEFEQSPEEDGSSIPSLEAPPAPTIPDPPQAKKRPAKKQKNKVIEPAADMSAPVSDDIDLGTEEPGPNTSRSPVLLAKSHAEFYTALEKVAILEDPVLIAKLALKYSEILDNLGDTETSAKLLALAEGVLDGK